MHIEQDIFQRTRVDFKKLEDYGFQKEDRVYMYSKVFMDSLKADIEIDEKGFVLGKIYDLNTMEEYTNFRVKNPKGEFVFQVRENYQNILEDIKNHCFEPVYFIGEQANRIAFSIMNIYQDEPEFLWEKYPGDGVFRNQNYGKWYGLIMNIDKSKLEKEETGMVEVINVKLDEKKIPLLLKKKGIYPSYHMNKKKWVTLILDDTLSDEEIIEYIQESHKYTELTNEWILPANPNYYDVIHCFQNTDTILWKQSNHMNIGDIVYLYVATPYSAILYQCVVKEVDIPYSYQDKNVSMKHVMRIHLVKEYSQDVFTFSKLNEYGIKAIRGPRRVPEALSKVLNQ